MTQKDTQKTKTNSYGHENKALLDKPIYDFTNKKTEKLVTALYMVTDCMETEDALKTKLRLLGVELLSDIYKFSLLTPAEKKSNVNSSISKIQEIISFIDISNTIGFISDMNTLILKKEFAVLLNDLDTYKPTERHFTFTLDEEMFEIKDNDFFKKDTNNPQNYLKDTNSIKRTPINNMSFIKQPSPLYSTHKRQSNVTTQEEREQRLNKIVSIIKDKKDNEAYKDGLSIKDISLSFSDCSEKTIQRDLNDLVSKNKITKNGSKRWSRYTVIQ